jgi:hypothetical protein
LADGVSYGRADYAAADDQDVGLVHKSKKKI